MQIKEKITDTIFNLWNDGVFGCKTELEKKVCLNEVVFFVCKVIEKHVPMPYNYVNVISGVNTWLKKIRHQKQN